MHTLRTSLFTVSILAATALTALAQVFSGTRLYFDHVVAEQPLVEKYQLCVDGTTSCQDIGVTKVGTGDTLAFTLPAVPRGKHDFRVVAVWKAPLTGTSAPTNVFTDNVVGGPERLRKTEAQ